MGNGKESGVGIYEERKKGKHDGNLCVLHWKIILTYSLSSQWVEEEPSGIRCGKEGRFDCRQFSTFAVLGNVGAGFRDNELLLFG